MNKEDYETIIFLFITGGAISLPKKLNEKCCYLWNNMRTQEHKSI
jgi:hypothetical protein